MRVKTDLPVVFCLHYLGGSAREWAGVAKRIPSARFVAIDLPGFGDAYDIRGYTVANMAEFVEHAIVAHAPQRWFLVGHSMGAKVATVVARRAEDGAGLSGLAGLVLLAGSPPSPEPMPESQRQTMLAYFSGDAASRQADARAYVAQNVGMPLDPQCEATAIDDALRSHRDAWRAWLEHGSREDWADRIGVIQSPTLLIAGADDANLGPKAQVSHMAPHFADVRLVTMARAKHLLPMERPEAIARAISEHVSDVAYRALIASDRVGERTRSALRGRARSDDPAYVPAVIDAYALNTLRAVLARVIPQDADRQIDLAARIDAQLHSGKGDGWRNDMLPMDRDAYHVALRTLDDVARREVGDAFAQLGSAEQDGILTRIFEGRLESAQGKDNSAHDKLNASQMRAWFEDLRADAVKIYLSHPQTLARIGYSGIANGGDGTPKTGFARVGLGARESWEPLARTERGR